MSTYPQRPLTHWTIRLEENWYLTAFDRGDAVCSLEGHNPHGGSRERYEMFIKMAHAQLDKYVDEYRCRASGGHEYVDDRCTKCFAWNLEALEREGTA